MRWLILRTLREFKRLAVLVIGGTVLILGVIMIVTPGPATVVIPIGLAILATEFTWAAVLLRRLKREARNLAARAGIGAPEPPGDARPQDPPADRSGGTVRIIVVFLPALSLLAGCLLPDPPAPRSEILERFQRLRAARVGAEERARIWPSANPHPRPAAGKVEMTLEECLRAALGYNFDIRVAEFFPREAAENVTAARGAFDPVLHAKAAVSREKLETGSSLSGASVLDTRRVLAEAGVDFRTGTGGTVRLFTETERVRTNSLFQTLDPSTTARLGVEARQPLLKGAGLEVNGSEIEEALRRREAADARLLAALNDTLFAVTRAYWELVLAHGTVEVSRTAHDLARSVLKNTDQRVQGGVAAPLERTQAQAAEARRREEVLEAENRLRKARDGLLHLLGADPDPRSFDVDLVPATPPELPEPRPEPPDPEGAAAEALRARPELLRARREIAATDALLVRLRNGTLPELDLFARAAATGLGHGLREAGGHAGTFDFPAWMLGVEFRFPLGNRRAEALERRALLEKASAEISLKDLESRVLVEVRQAHGDFGAALERVGAADEFRRFAVEQYEAEAARLSQGKSTQLAVDQLLQDKVEAEVGALQARVDYFVARAAFARARGAMGEAVGPRD